MLRRQLPGGLDGEEALGYVVEHQPHVAVLPREIGLRALEAERDAHAVDGRSKDHQQHERRHQVLKELRPQGAPLLLGEGLLLTGRGHHTGVGEAGGNLGERLIHVGHVLAGAAIVAPVERVEECLRVSVHDGERLRRLLQTRHQRLRRIRRKVRGDLRSKRHQVRVEPRLGLGLATPLRGNVVVLEDVVARGIGVTGGLGQARERIQALGPGGVGAHRGVNAVEQLLAQHHTRSRREQVEEGEKQVDPSLTRKLGEDAGDELHGGAGGGVRCGKRCRGKA